MNKTNMISFCLVTILIDILEFTHPGFLGFKPEFERMAAIILSLMVISGVIWTLVIEKIFYSHSISKGEEPET